MKKLFLVAFTMLFAFGCTEEVLLPELIQGSDGLTSLIDLQVVAPTDQHPNGGVMMLVGLDENRDGTLSSSEVQFQFPIWHGADGVDGKDGVSPTVSIIDGYWYINGENTGVLAEGQNGSDGADGKDGTQITISEDGFWIIDGEKTDVKAEGKDGADGKDGMTLTPIFVDTPLNPTEEHLNGGVLVTVYVDKNQDEFLGSDEIVGMYTVWHGNDGLTPYIDEETGNWFIGDLDTGIGAEGKEGEDGLTPHIGQNGNWFIGEYDTEVKAQGPQGNDGTVINYQVEEATTCDDGGYTITITLDDETNYSYTICNGVDGEVGPQGPQGLNGNDGVCDCEENLCDECYNCEQPSYYTYTTNFSKNGGQKDRNTLNANGWAIFGFQSANNFNVIYSASDAIFGGVMSNGTLTKNSKIQSPELYACELEEVSVWAKTLDAKNINNVNTFPDHNANWRYRLVIMYCDGTEEIITNPTGDSNNWTNGRGPNDDQWKQMKWTGSWFNVSKVRVEVERKDSQGTHRTAVNKMQIKVHSTVNLNSI